MVVFNDLFGLELSEENQNRLQHIVGIYSVGLRLGSWAKFEYWHNYISNLFSHLGLIPLHESRHRLSVPRLLFSSEFHNFKKNFYPRQD